MRSIRISLTVYLTTLLFVALGAVSLLVYQTTRSSLEISEENTKGLLRSKHAATVELLRIKRDTAQNIAQTKCIQDCEREENRLNEALLSQARTLARLVQFQFDWTPVRYNYLQFLGSLGALTTPNGALCVPLWVVEGAPRRNSEFGRPGWNATDDLNQQLIASIKTQITFTDNDLLDHIDEHVAEFFQVNSAWGSVYHSQKLEGRTFDYDRSVFESDQVLTWGSDDAWLGPMQKVRRVWLKAPAARFVPFSGRFRSPRSRVPDLARPEVLTRPAIFIQVACDVQKLDAPLKVFKERLRQENDQINARFAEDVELLETRLQADLTAVHSETSLSLDRLWQNLLTLSVATFFGIILGACGLVRLGLLPLNRLGDAVSKVSEKDFRLQVDQARLPRELTPIVDRLNATLEQLKLAFAREKQATADISHELRTPLAALRTTIDVTLRKPRKVEEYCEALTECRVSAIHMTEAVERLLSLARLDAGVDRARSQPADAADVARQCVSVIRPLAESQGLHLQFKSEEPIPVLTDPEKLREIVNNLLHNAIQYNRPQGSVDVSVARQNGHVVLEVSDTGIGISAEARTRIFERFYRADPSRQSDGMHAGLGLAIVKGYVDLMGGRIDVESTEGAGSTFRIHLPAR